MNVFCIVREFGGGGGVTLAFKQDILGFKYF